VLLAAAHPHLHQHFLVIMIVVLMDHKVFVVDHQVIIQF
jgi:hypothetical protein